MLQAIWEAALGGGGAGGKVGSGKWEVERGAGGGVSRSGGWGGAERDVFEFLAEAVVLRPIEVNV